MFLTASPALNLSLVVDQPTVYGRLMALLDFYLPLYYEQLYLRAVAWEYTPYLIGSCVLGLLVLLLCLKWAGRTLTVAEEQLMIEDVLATEQTRLMTLQHVAETTLYQNCIRQ
jgi:hypothetical protein